MSLSGSIYKGWAWVTIARCISRAQMSKARDMQLGIIICQSNQKNINSGSALNFGQPAVNAISIQKCEILYYNFQQQKYQYIIQPSSVVPMAQLKNDKFKNEIRRRHKEKIMSDLRSKLHYQNNQEDSFQTLSKWRLYLQNPTPIVPLEAVKFFLSIQENDPYLLERIINQILHPTSLLNVLFVTLCVQAYSIPSTKFLQRVLESEKVKSFQQIKFYTNLQNWEQVYLGYYVIFMKKFNLNREETLEVALIEVIRKEFVQYWNSHVEQKTLNYKLCAQILERFLKFMQPIAELKPLVRGAVSVLIDSDSSPETYYLVKIILSSCHVKLGLFITQHPNFPKFIYNGFKQSTTKLVIQIIENLIERKQEYGKLQIKYEQVLRIMYRLLMETDNKNIEHNLLLTFYNFTFSEEVQVEQFYQEISYQDIHRKIYKKNLLVFLDFCLSAIYNYHSKVLFDKIVEGEELKLFEQSCEYIFNESNNQAWRYAGDMLDAIEMLVEHSIQIDYLCQKMELVVKKLESMKWHHNLGEKQRLLQAYEAMIRRCAEFRNG